MAYDSNKVKSLQPKMDKRVGTSTDAYLPFRSVIDFAEYLQNQCGPLSGEMIFWIIHRYVTFTNGKYGIERYSDIRLRVFTGFEKFERIKAKKNIEPPLVIKDLNQIKSLDALDEILSPYPDIIPSIKEADLLEEKTYYDSDQAVQCWNDDQVKIVVPRSIKAAQYFGKNTKWCTSAESDNRFEQYFSTSPLYIVLLKKLNKRYQFHFPRFEFNDDENISSDMRALCEAYPVLYDVFNDISIQHNSLAFVKNPNAGLQYKAVCYSLDNLRHLEHPTEEVQQYALGVSSAYYQWIKNPSETSTKTVLATDWKFLGHISDPSEELIEIAVKLNHDAIGLLANKPSDEFMERLLKINGYVLKYVEDQTDEMHRIAFQYDPNTLQYMKNPSRDICIQCLDVCPEAIHEIENPSMDMIEKAIMRDTDISRHFDYPEYTVILDKAVRKSPTLIGVLINISEHVKLREIRKAPVLLKLFSIQTEEMIRAALESDGNAILHVLNPTYDHCEIAAKTTPKTTPDVYGMIHNPPHDLTVKWLTQNPSLVWMIKNTAFTAEFAWISLKGDPNNMQYLVNPTEEMIDYVIEKDPATIRFIVNSSTKQQMVVLNHDINLFEKIKNPTDEVKNYLKKKSREYRKATDGTLIKNKPKKIWGKIFLGFWYVSMISAAVYAGMH